MKGMERERTTLHTISCSPLCMDQIVDVQLVEQRSSIAMVDVIEGIVIILVILFVCWCCVSFDVPTITKRAIGDRYRFRRRVERIDKAARASMSMSDRLNRVPTTQAELASATYDDDAFGPVL